MSNLFELADQGRKIRKEAEERDKIAFQKSEVRKTKISIAGLLRRSQWSSVLLSAGIMLICFGVIGGFIDTSNNIPVVYLYAAVAAGVVFLSFAMLFAWQNLRRSQAWEKSLPFKLPAYYQRFLNSQFSFTTKGSGTTYYEAGIEIKFEDPFDPDIVTNAVIGLGEKGVSVETGNMTDEQLLEELEHPVETPEPPEDDEEYFNTPDEPMEAKTEDEKNEKPVILLIKGDHFVNGNDFEKFFKRLTSEILIPLHRESTIISVELTNDHDLEFMDL